MPEKLSFDAGGNVGEFEIPAPAARPSAFAFSLHKAGSVMLDRILAQMAAAAGVPAVNFPSDAFRQGITEAELTREAIGPVLMRDGYVFTGFRMLAGFIPPETLAGRRKLLLIRDPRDMLVSLYFSHRYSHPIPPKGAAREALLAARSETGATDIDSFVLSESADFIARNYRDYIDAIDGNWRIYRYEDVIFRKRDWLPDMAAWLDLPVGRSRLGEIADRHDLRPETENRNAHVRQVLPGNHRRHLAPATIAALNERLADILRFHAVRRF